MFFFVLISIQQPLYNFQSQSYNSVNITISLNDDTQQKEVNILKHQFIMKHGNIQAYIYLCLSLRMILVQCLKYLFRKLLYY